LQAENEFLRRDFDAAGGATAFTGINDLIAESPSMKPVLDVIRRIGPSDANVLITGENGTGKGLVARALHTVNSRAPSPLITVNMGGLSENLFESELFGHVKGAFTDAKSDRAGRFELADGGTLFLDEIGRFRRDLFFRLNTVELRLPALRDRREDIPLLARHFLSRHANRYRKSLVGFTKEADQALSAHSWPGNVRELDHTIERATLMASEVSIQSSDLGLQSTSTEPNLAIGIEQMSLEDIEKLLIKKSLARFGGNARQAAEALGLSRSTFYRRLQQYGM
jgi:DNA-binding NtrC family response regulator